ncbi:hypothetical protein SDC9_110807 [bioreactor metagenome]|uniref:Uncharacterized protein n=1 Tax=bioreactor metagenome TaxID=1076179 RepID=A0A645BF09_9ZZZZ
MSKYDKLWEFISTHQASEMKLSFDEIQAIIGIPLDHSFLNFKKELLEYHYQVAKISLKEKFVIFVKLNS